MATVDKIAVQISAEIGSLKRDLDQARAELRGFQGSALSAADASTRAFARMQKELQDISRAAGVTGAVMRGAFAAVAAYGVTYLAERIAEAAKRTMEFADDAKRAAVNLGEFRAIANAGQRMGIDVEDMAEAMKEVNKLVGEAGRGEGDLKELFDANNVKIKERNGSLISTVEALARIADLVRNAGSEADKLKILSELGLDEKLVRVLEQGGDAIRRMASEGRPLTGELEAQAKAAAEFHASWTKAWQDFGAFAMPIATGILNILRDIIGLAAQLPGALAKAGQTVRDFEQAQTPMKDWTGEQWRRGLEIKKWTRDNIDADGERMFDTATERDREAARAAGMGRLNQGGLEVTVPGGRGKPTIIPKSKGGGGGGKDEKDAEEKQIERFILTLEKEARAVKAEAEAFFLSNIEKQTAINLAKAGEKATDDQKKQIEAATKTLVEQQEALKQLKLAKEGVNEAFQFGGSMLLDFANGMIEGGKASDLMKNSLKRLSAALLEMTILGQGPLAKLFGMSGRDGAPGGLVGLLMGGFGKGGISFGGSGIASTVGDVGGFARAFAGGGPAGPGWAMVGENGPELIRLGRSAEVYSVGATRSMMMGGGRGGGGPIINQTIMGNGDATIAAIARQATAQGLAAYQANWHQNAESARLRGA